MDWRILYNPLAVLGTRKGFVMAVLIVIVLTAIAYWGGVHLDGALDLHINPGFPSLALVIVESLSAWLCLALCLFGASRMFGGNGGLAPHMAVTGLARFPYVLSAIIASRPILGNLMLKGVIVKPGEITVRPQEMMLPAIIIGGLAIVGLTVWAIGMLYFGYREASRTEGAKAFASFVIGLIVAELISKLLVVCAVNAM